MLNHSAHVDKMVKREVEIISIIRAMLLGLAKAIQYQRSLAACRILVTL